MPARTWDSRELPILKAIAERDDGRITTHEIVTETGLPRDEVLKSIRVLTEAGYIHAALMDVAESDAPLDADGMRLLERGKRATDVWPPEDAAAGFLEAIDLAIAREPDEQRRSALDRFRGAAVSLGRTALGEVVRQVIDRGITHTPF